MKTSRHFLSRATWAWLFLLALTLATAVAGLWSGEGPGWPWLLALGLVSFLKARTILSDYLDLRRAPDWRAGFLATTALLLAIVYGLSLVAGA